MLISTMSASLPGVSVPVLWSRPQARAPCSVANSSTSRLVSGSGSTIRFSSSATLLTISRVPEMRWRIALNMSQGTVVTTSIEMLGRTPASSSLSAGGRPWPICISSSGAIEAVPPVSPMIWNSRR